MVLRVPKCCRQVVDDCRLVFGLALAVLAWLLPVRRGSETGSQSTGADT